MRLRTRLALWYGVLTGLVVILVVLLAYVIHVRTHYDQVDATLDAAAEHALTEYLRGQLPSMEGDSDGTLVSAEVPVQVYDRDGTLIAATPSARSAPAISPQLIVGGSNPAPYDWLARLIPISLYEVEVTEGSFGLVQDADGARWRVVVVPVPGRAGYLVAMSSLASIDESISGIRWLIVSLAVGGTVVTLAGGWVLAGRALRPIRALTDTAGTIARLRTFDRRVPVRGADELADMSATFNLMLDELEAVYRMQQQFVSDASHELRAPLTTIQANLEFLSRQRQLAEDERQEVIDESRHETNRLARLVADLLSLARADSGVVIRQEDVELDRLLLEVMHDTRHLSHDEQALTIQNIEPVEITGDSDRLRQLLVIVLDNAVKYTPDDGSITVALRRSGSTAELVVSDTGVGISAEDLPRIFDRFYRADPARTRDPGGTGLGLSIAWWIVEQHGGGIAVDSELGVDTTISIRLPL